MPLSTNDALSLAKDLVAIRDTERARLELIHDYLVDDPDRRRRLGGLPDDAPDDVIRLARISRVNLLKYVVSARTQGLYVDGFQTPSSPDNVGQWEIWQRNRMDARQIGIHRAALSYGAAYNVVLPGTPVPVMRGASPRDLSVAYGDDDDWPRAALWKRRNGRWRLIDDTSVYELTDVDGSSLKVVGEPSEHRATADGEPVCPVVRYRDTDDLDDPVRGIVEPHIALQDQVNITTFGLLVAQHYGAFKQRAIIGWMAESEAAAIKMGADRTWMFEDEGVKLHEFAQTELRGYIESRESSIRHLATVSQTAVHELMGQFVNLSADALEAARASHQAGIDENRTMMGEAHEQALNLAGEMAGIAPDPSASVLWRDTRVRSLTEAAQAFGLLAEKLGVPARELWQRIPGIPQHEVERWESVADQADPFTDLAAMLDRQSAA